MPTISRTFREEMLRCPIMVKEERLVSSAVGLEVCPFLPSVSYAEEMLTLSAVEREERARL